MENKQLYSSLCRTVSCEARQDDYDYWSARCINIALTNTEISQMINFVEGDPMMRHRVISTDAKVSRSLEMELCHTLLKYDLKTQWIKDFPTQEGLLLIGSWDTTPDFSYPSQNMVFLNGKAISIESLPSKDELVQELFEAI